MRPLFASVAVVMLAATASAQTVRITGTVVDEGRSTPIQGATVRLTGGASVTTTANGRFQFDSVVPGRYLLTSAAVGYRFQSLDLTLARDTSLTIVMATRTVTLDTMVVRPRSVRIKATAVDSASGDYLMQAQAFLYPGGRSVGAVSGVFVFDSVPPGPTTIVVEALEHLPARVELDAVRDTTFTVKLGVDSVALRMIAIQVKRLDTRSRAIAMPTTSLNRDAIARDQVMSISDLIARRMDEDPVIVRRTSAASPDGACFFLDDVKVTRDVYAGVLPELVERVEIFKEPGGPPPTIRGRSTPRNRGGIRMVRVYTKRYVATLPRQATLPRVIYVPGTRVACM